jgi:signal recognition particle receptor subunit beta
MASVNPLSRELVFKVVYYGPGLGGKTTTLEHIHATAKPDHRGKLVSLATPVDRTLYFDFLPMRLPPIRGMHVRLQLFTVPGQVYFNATRKLVLTGADGIVFVADSQTARADANLESLDNLRDNLADQGRNLNDVPIVFQYNKYDLADVLSVAELDKLLNRSNAPSLATSARTGLGVYEGLEKITHAVLASFETQMPESVRVAAAAAYDPHEEGLAAALRGASQGEDRPPTSGAIFNRVASSRVALGSIPPETGSEEAPPIDKAAMRAAALPVTTFPDAPDDGWGSKEKLAIAPATDASILTRHEGARSHSSRGPDSRSGESPRSRNRPSVLPPKPFAPLIPQAGPPRTHAPAAPPNATTSAPKETAPSHQAHAPSPPANATVAATPTKITPGADRAPSTEKTIALQVKPPTSPKPEAAKIEVVQPKPEPAKIAVAPAKPEPPKHEPLKLDVAPVKPEPPKVEPPKVEAAFAPPKPEPPKHEPEPAKVDVAPAKPERLDPTMLFSIADLLEPPVETTLEVPQPPQS